MNESSTKEQIKITNLIFYSLIAGVILFFIFANIVIQNRESVSVDELDNIFKVAVPIFGLLMVFLSQMIYRKSLSLISTELNLIQKIQKYRTSKITSWAMIEGACLFSLISLYITANYLYAIIFITLLVIFILQRPSKESFIVDFRLNAEEREIVHKS